MRSLCAYFAVGLGLLLSLLGIHLAGNDGRETYVSKMGKELSLRNGSEAMKMWRSAPVPVFFKVYLWNVTNPKEVSAGGKPRLAEVGPYVYEQWLQKENVREEANDTLSYNQNSKMFFHERLTGERRETDLVTIVHLPIVGTVLLANEMMPDYVSYLDGVWTTLFPGAEDIFMRGTVRELLFDGVPIDCRSKDFVAATVCNNLEESSPKTVRKVGSKEFRFSFFHYRTRLSPDLIRVHRGVEKPQKTGQMFSFNNEMSMNTWHDKYCDMLNGSDGSRLPMNLDRNDSVYLFQPDLCRSLYARYEGEVRRGGVRLYRYVNTPDLLASKEENPDNECFCVPKASLGDVIAGFDDGGANGSAAAEAPAKVCLKSGAVALTPCLGAPVVISFPHFYMADRSFLEYVDLSPRKELHQTFVDVEPLSGVPFAASKRIQFNVEVKSIPDAAFMSNLSGGLFPILWVEESFELQQEMVDKLKMFLIFSEYANPVGYACLGAAVVAFVVGYLCREKRRPAEAAGGREKDAPGLPGPGTGRFLPGRGLGRTAADGLRPLGQKAARVFPDPSDPAALACPEGYM